MPVYALLLAAGLWAWLFGSLPGADEGRTGNRHYASGDYQKASLAYLAGIEAMSSHMDPAGDEFLDADQRGLGARLLHNTALSLYQMEGYDEALQSFTLASQTAGSPDPEVAAAALYGAGLAAARLEQYDAALEHFAQALRLRPDFPEAAYNWEWVRRQMPDAPPPEQDEQAPPPEPTPFAENLKAQADELVAQRRYREAQELMLDGLEQDSTVGAYADFTERLGAVADIDEL